MSTVNAPTLSGQPTQPSRWLWAGTALVLVGVWLLRRSRSR